MPNTIAELFSLQGLNLRADRLDRTGKEILIQTTNMKRAARCPRCHTVSRRIHETRPPQKIKHSFFEGKVVYLVVQKRRFWCKGCLRPFTEIISGIDKHAKVSNHCKEVCVSELTNQSFLRVGKKFNLSHAQLSRYLRDMVGKREILWPTRGDIRLGIDGHSFSGKEMATTVTDLARGRLLTILPNDRRSTILKFLANIPKEVRIRITEICIDMEYRYKTIVEEALGKRVRITVDHFHVIQEANRVIDETRRALQSVNNTFIPRKIFLRGQEKVGAAEWERLIDLFDQYPKLHALWTAKEDLRTFYLVSNKRVAAYKLSKIIKNLDGIESGYAKTFAKTLTRWKVEILNYFDNHTTNGFTEGCHTKIKLLKRMSYGFKNKTNYICKMTLAFLPLFYVINHPTI